MDKEYYAKNRDKLLAQAKIHRDSFLHPCPSCGVPISRYAKHCRHCMNKFKQSPNWNGGKTLTKTGYVRVWAPEHPRSKGTYVYEHIMVWERVNGKPLPKGWHIHHLNGIKNDNRPDNLLALSNRKHSLLITELSKHIQKLEALLKNQLQLL